MTLREIAEDRAGRYATQAATRVLSIANFCKNRTQKKQRGKWRSVFRKR